MNRENTSKNSEIMKTSKSLNLCLCDVHCTYSNYLLDCFCLLSCISCVCVERSGRNKMHAVAKYYVVIIIYIIFTSQWTTSSRPLKLQIEMLFMSAITKICYNVAVLDSKRCLMRLLT